MEIKGKVHCFFEQSGFTYQEPLKRLRVRRSKPAPKAGLCSEGRSMISPDYARNFICDFIIGKVQQDIYPSLFDDEDIK